MQYASLKDKIRAEKQMRAERNAQYQALFDIAMREGFRAGELVKPREMLVSDPYSGQNWTVSEGACGFAWVKVYKANKGFGHWLLKTGKARKSYYGGAEIWISAHGQSVDRKLAHASAMAQVFRNAGFESFADSRLD